MKYYYYEIYKSHTHPIFRASPIEYVYNSYILIYIYGYGSIPINTIFSGMNIHLPAILMFTRGTRFWHTAIYDDIKNSRSN